MLLQLWSEEYALVVVGFSHRSCFIPIFCKTLHLRQHQCMGLERKGKGRKKRARSSSPTKALPPQDKGCHICLKKDHFSFSCPYRYEYPPGAIVGRFAEIVCLCCGEEKPHPGVPGLDWKAKVDLKDAFVYPSIDEQLMELNNTITSEGTAYGTGNNASTLEGAAYGMARQSRRKA